MDLVACCLDDFVVLCNSVRGVVSAYIVASCGCVGYLVALLCWVYL